MAPGAADQLAGRILRPGDDLAAPGAACQADPDRRRLPLELR
jgi:hypothetical protein